MKRSALWCIALMLAGVSTARAQGLTMQMSNGWAFTFTGNVNAFLMYTDGKVDSAAGPIAGGLVPAEQVTRIRTGLLPGFANFEAAGKEGNLDLKVHFGFAPQIQTNGEHDNFGNGTQAGAQIDMREVYLTLGGSWGTILAGRELGLYQRQNILTDATLGGVGASGGGVGAAGTTLGRIGFGYIYPNFNSQITYSTPAGRPAQLSIGLFDPSFVMTDLGEARGTKLPRLEAEFTWTGNFGSEAGGGGQMSSPDRIMFWVNGMVQHVNAFSVDPAEGDNPGLTSSGVGGGLKLDASGWSVVGSGYYSTGVGTTLMFDGISSFDADTTGRKTWGYIGQVTYTPPKSQWTVGASWGESHVNQTSLDVSDGNNTLVKYNRAADAMLTYQWTKSLRWVLEYTWARAASYAGSQNTSNQGATGFMLFF